AFAYLETELKSANEKNEALKAKLQKLIDTYKDRLAAAKRTLESCSTNFDVRRLAACTKDDYEVFYILCGWMSERDADAFQEDIRDDENVYFFVENYTGHELGMPPTKLRNPKLFRPFEMFIRMYGLPAYNEIDPT